MVVAVVPEQVDHAARDHPHRHRRGDAPALQLRDPVSADVLGRRRLGAAPPDRAGWRRPLDAVGFLSFHRALAVGCLPRPLPVLLCCLDARLAHRVGEMARARRTDLLRLPQHRPHLWRRRHTRLPAVDPVLCADRPCAEPRPGTRGAPRQARQPDRPRGAAAAVHQFLGVRLHAADAAPDGGAILLQRHRQAER